MAKNLPIVGKGYDEFLRDLKERIRTAQIKAALAVNRELVLLYWQMGRQILARQKSEGWGAKVIEQLAKDLKSEFPDMTGLSRTNLLYMRAFAEAYLDESIVQQAAGQIPWFHNCVLLDKIKDPEQRLWYIQQTIANGWSRNVLVLQIESRLFERQGCAITNFEQALPKPQSDLAQQLLKDPYNFEFLTISQNAQELELERGLVTHIRDFLLELGMGFSFVGSQYPLEVDGTEYRIDLLFYHLQLRCFVVIDLKMGAFQPEFSGKMNFYVAVVDDLLRHETDNPTIGLILCKSKSRTTAEYALRNIQTPIGVSTHKLPQPLQENLPSIEQLEMELQTIALSQEELDLVENC
ncbi:YhcG family protein [Altericista sp. CCNU0014]|uniref:PDDEXK nuclease domain-containing protein n=1 Tax=Altericista sp. CCNU0014 TaxID=3082949 RepID=UPI00384DAFD3